MNDSRRRSIERALLGAHRYWQIAQVVDLYEFDTGVYPWTRLEILVATWTEEPYDRFLVVVNDEEQYSIWPDVRPIPDGWRKAGFEGPKEECLHHIDDIWTDMRPRSLRERMTHRQA